MDLLTVDLLTLAFGAAGAILGVAADRLATRWPEHDPDEADEHPPGRRPGWRTVVVGVFGVAALAVVAQRFGADPLALAVFGAWFASLVVGLATDLDQRLLPDPLTLPAIPVAFVFALSGLNPLVGADMLPAVGAAVLIPAALYLPSLLFGAGAFGIGDVKLLVSVGLMLGARLALAGLLFGLLVAGIVLVVLLAARRIGRRSYVPFGPFLILGALWGVVIGG